MVLKVLETKIHVFIEKRSGNCLRRLPFNYITNVLFPLNTMHFYRCSYYFFLILETTQPFPQHQGFRIHSSTSIHQAAEVSKIQSSRIMKIGSSRGKPLLLQKESLRVQYYISVSPKSIFYLASEHMPAAQPPQHGGAFSSQ